MGEKESGEGREEREKNEKKSSGLFEFENLNIYLLRALNFEPRFYKILVIFFYFLQKRHKFQTFELIFLN